MDRIKLDPNSRYGRIVRIGFEGENAVRKIDFDMADWQKCWSFCFFERSRYGY